MFLLIAFELLLYNSFSNANYQINLELQRVKTKLHTLQGLVKVKDRSTNRGAGAVTDTAQNAQRADQSHNKDDAIAGEDSRLLRYYQNAVQYRANLTLGCNPVAREYGCLESWGFDQPCALKKVPYTVVFHKKSWLSWQVDVGVHDCPTTTCTSRVGEDFGGDAHGWITAIPPYPKSLPEKTRPGQRIVMLNIESRRNHPKMWRQSEVPGIDLYLSHTAQKPSAFCSFDRQQQHL